MSTSHMLHFFARSVISAGLILMLIGCEGDKGGGNETKETTMNNPSTKPAEGASCTIGDKAACGTGFWKGKTDEEWRKTLTPEQYRVAREAGTERAFTGKYWDTHTKGIYHCAACGQPLFDSETKFDSGTGWPSFWRPLKPDAVTEHSDSAHFMVRTEVKCSQCEAHLGHVFDDGPAPTGKRYCMNSAVLNLIPAEGAQAEK